MVYKGFQQEGVADEERADAVGERDEGEVHSERIRKITLKFKWKSCSSSLHWVGPPFSWGIIIRFWRKWKARTSARVARRGAVNFNFLALVVTLCWWWWWWSTRWKAEGNAEPTILGWPSRRAVITSNNNDRRAVTRQPLQADQQVFRPASSGAHQRKVGFV